MEKTPERKMRLNTFYLRVLVSVFIVVTLLFALLLSGYTMLLRRTSVQEYRQLVQTSVSNTNNTFSQYYKNVQISCEKLYTSVDGTRIRIEENYAPAHVSKIAKEIRETFRMMPYADSFCMLDRRDNVVLYVANPDSGLFLREYEPELKAQLNASQGLRYPIVWPAQRRYHDQGLSWMLSLYYRESPPDAPTYKGTAVINVDMQALSAALFSQSEEVGIDCFIMNTDGIVVAHSDPIHCGEDWSERPFAEQILSGGGSDPGVTVGGETMEVYAERCAGTQFYAAALYQPLNGAAKASGWLLGAAGITLAVVLAAAILLYVVCFYAFKPFNRIMQDVKTSDLMKNVDGRADDLSILNQYHSEMADSLSTLREKESKDQIVKALLKQQNVDALLLENRYIVRGLPYCLVLVHLGEETDKLVRLSEYDSYKRTFGRLCAEELKELGRCTCFEIGFRRIMLLISADALQSGQQTLMPALDTICSRFHAEEQAQVTVYLSDRLYAGSEAERCSTAFQTGESCLKTYRFLMEEEQSVILQQPRLSQAWRKPLGQAIQATRDGSRDDFRRALSTVFDELKTQRWEIFAQAMLLLASGIVKGRNENQLPKDFEKLAHQKISYAGNKEELITWLTELYDDAYSWLQTVNEYTPIPVMERVVNYVNEHYENKNLNLNLIAEKIHISAPYLGKLFRDFTGSSFNDYLLHLRMTRACELLLLEREKSIAEIAREVGYSNNSYFTSSFRKCYGISPSQYRVYRESDQKPQENTD